MEFEPLPLSPGPVKKIPSLVRVPGVLSYRQSADNSAFQELKIRIKSTTQKMNIFFLPSSLMGCQLHGPTNEKKLKASEP